MQGDLCVIRAQRPHLRDFLVAQLRWERCRAARVALVHLLAFSAVFLWVPLAVRWRAAISTASVACFIGALCAGLLEWHWGRERNRRAGVFTERGDPH
jgi:hypothetical protein